MNPSVCLLTAALYGLFTTAGWAQSVSSREFTRLKEQRDAAVATAIAPIDQKYHEMLKTLLTRATQEGDFTVVTAITDILSAGKAAAGASKPTSMAKTAGSVASGIWAVTSTENFYYVMVTQADNTVDGFIYIGAPNKSATLAGKKTASTIQAHWPSVYGGESWDGKFTERADGGFDLERVYADGPSKGRKDSFQLNRLKGDDYKRARKLLDSKVTTKEGKSALRKLPRE